MSRDAAGTSACATITYEIRRPILPPSLAPPALSPTSCRRPKTSSPEDPDPAHRPGHHLRSRSSHRNARHRSRRARRIPALHRTARRPQPADRFVPAASDAELQQRRRSTQGLNDRDVRIVTANLDSMNLLSARKTLHPSRVLPKPVQGNALALRRAAIVRYPQLEPRRRRHIHRRRRYRERCCLRTGRNRQDRHSRLRTGGRQVH